MPIRRKDDLLGRLLRIALQSAADAAARDELQHARAILFNRVVTTDHLQSGRIPRRERKRIEQEVEEATAEAMLRLAEIRHDRPDTDDTEAFYRAVNWAALKWSLRARINRVERDAATEHTRLLAYSTIDTWGDNDDNDE